MCRKPSFACSSLVLAGALILGARPATADDPKPGGSRAEEVKKDLAPRLVTLTAQKIRLREALKQLTKQTRIEIEDRRRTEDAGDPELKLDLKAVTFWQALDSIAKEADLRVGLYQRGGALALMDGPHVQLPTCYDGLFRIVLRRITAVHDLETDQRFCIANLEIAWEPRFRPLFLESRPQSFVVTDDAKTRLHADDEPGGKVPVSGKIATSLELHLPAPPRKSAKLGLLEGSLTLVGPSKMLDFEFDTLAKEKAAKDPKQTKDGVTVKLRRLDLAADHWTVEVGLDYPDDGPKFESFQSWVVNNECFLRKAEGDAKFDCNGGYSIDSLGANKAILSYHFVDGRQRKTVDGKVVTVRLVRGKPEDWKLVYRTPGPMAEVAVKFQFKDVPLP
jgi:hypothetical protein